MKIFSMTDVGRKREMNQDYVFATDESLGTLPNLLVVADGMGGHKAGDFASKYTVEVLKEELKHTLKDGPEEILKDAELPFKMEYIFPDLKSPNGRPLRFDFVVFDDDGKIDFIIEY